MAYKARASNGASALDDIELMRRVRTKEQEKQIRLSLPQRRLYVLLVDYAVTYGRPYGDKGLIVYLTEKEMGDKFNASKSMVNKCMLLFRQLGLIVRVQDDIDGRGKNTIIPCEYFKKEND